MIIEEIQKDRIFQDIKRIRLLNKKKDNIIERGQKIRSLKRSKQIRRNNNKIRLIYN